MAIATAEKRRNSAAWFSSYVSGRTDILSAILRTPRGDEVARRRSVNMA